MSGARHDTVIGISSVTNKQTQQSAATPRLLTLFFSLSILGTHLQEKPHICKICGMGFKESPRLKTHILTAHQGIKFSCDICGKEYLDRRGLNRHKQNVHGNVNVNVTVKEDITE